MTKTHAPTATALLAATDFSPPARRAAERAAQLAAANGNRLALLHCLDASALEDLRRWLGSSGGAEQAVLDEAGEQLAELAATLRHGHGIAVEEQVARGGRVREICEAARRAGAGLIVVGHSGSGAQLWRLALGSTAEAVLRRCDAPVLSVRQPVRGPYRNVLVPIDFSPASLEALVAARRLLRHARMVLLHVVQAPFEGKLRTAGVEESAIERYLAEARTAARRELERLASAQGLGAAQFVCSVVHGDPAQAIVQQEEEHDCDLVAIGRQGRNALDELLLGSVTRHVLTQGQSDVLVVPAAAA